ncbi:hypothetical protein HDU85_002940 [Gaertneriomyces sp. JEL0708]|nr:hypothetical protein HDU85_002940 [Gaertneriomyces sp. JEL0708]
MLPSTSSFKPSKKESDAVNTTATRNGLGSPIDSSIAQILKREGFDGTTQSALDLFSLATEIYLGHLATSLATHATHSGRTIPSLLDLSKTLQRVGVTASDLATYLLDCPQPLPLPITPSFPRGTKPQEEPKLQYPAPKAKERKYIPSHLPPLPPPHTHMRTPLPPQPPQKTQTRALHQRHVEDGLTKLLSATAVHSKAASFGDEGESTQVVPIVNYERNSKRRKLRRAA